MPLRRSNGRPPSTTGPTCAIAELARAHRAGGSTSREKALRVYAEDLAADLADARSELRAREEDMAVLGERIAALEAEQRRVAGSVSMQVVQRTSAAFYAVVGRRSFVARALQASLRVCGRLLTGRRAEPCLRLRDGGPLRRSGRSSGCPHSISRRPR